MNDKFDISKWKRKLITENSTEPSKEKDSFAQAEDNLYKKVTGEEPKASSANKFRDLKEGETSLEDQIYEILDDAFDGATSQNGYEADYTSKSDLCKIAIPKILELIKSNNG